MKLESKIVIRRTPDQVWRFLGDPSNIPRWDRSVGEIQAVSSCAMGEQVEFATVAPHEHPGGRLKDRGRMSYKVTEADPAGRCTVQLTSSTGNARFFETAQWHFMVEPVEGGSLLTCISEFTLRLRYLFLAPVFYAMKNALRSDLTSLKRVLENE